MSFPEMPFEWLKKAMIEKYKTNGSRNKYSNLNELFADHLQNTIPICFSFFKVYQSEVLFIHVGTPKSCLVISLKAKQCMK